MIIHPKNYSTSSSQSQDDGINFDRKFKVYTDSIVKHKNYSGLPYKKKGDGQIVWVATKKSQIGKARMKWWTEKCHEYNIPIEDGCWAKIARKVHPTGMHTCQCCGKEMSIFYEYMKKPMLKKVNARFKVNYSQDDYTIREAITQLCKTQGDNDFFASLFGLSSGLQKDELVKEIYDRFVHNNDGILSPGVMSNLPDRYDGFHSYGLCCRKEKDKGRHDENMATYTQDRRAYEEWADGDFNLANRLMGEFKKAPKCICPKCRKLRKMSADHIGPISLGFCHSKNFAAMCKSCNSSKNNRFTYEDVKTLREIEEKGEKVISWHAKTIWDALKNKVTNDADAKKLSELMSACHQNILGIFAEIHSLGGDDFLKSYLHPDYAMYDITFEDFDPLDLSKLKIKSKKLDSDNKKSNSERYVRVAFDSLNEFAQKKNRRADIVVDEFKDQIQSIVDAFNDGKMDSAKQQLQTLIDRVSAYFVVKWN